MDIQRIARQHPRLLEKILAKSTGAIGEVLVADRLDELGYKVEPTNNNARQCDLMACSPGGASFSIEVKTDRQKRPTWFVRTRPDEEASEFWVFISAPRKPTELPDPIAVEMYVLSVEEVQELWDASDWNKRNPTNGDIRRWQIPDDALNSWTKLPK
ncbi:hypothetical protein ACOTTU_13130 [Roseobacter sp. EG26]|uniref:hypothetical protein n=1 Tax=Roseobacter sp. EG26 TaxID=3412477 RepID=UPI003CE5A9E5